MTKQQIWKYLGPTIAWGIRLLVVSAVIFGFAWYFEVGWNDIKDVIVLIIEIFSVSA